MENCKYAGMNTTVNKPICCMDNNHTTLLCVGGDYCKYYEPEAEVLEEPDFETIVEKDFCNWLKDESKKLNLDADHFGEILGKVLFGSIDRKE